MRHHNKVKKFGREKNQRVALMQSLARSLILLERIETTEAKAKALRPYVEKLVTKARVIDLAKHRQILATLRNRKDATTKLIQEIAPKYKDRKGGYVRIIKLPPRKTDSSKMALIEFV